MGPVIQIGLVPIVELKLLDLLAQLPLRTLFILFFQQILHSLVWGDRLLGSPFIRLGARPP